MDRIRVGGITGAHSGCLGPLECFSDSKSTFISKQFISQERLQETVLNRLPSADMDTLPAMIKYLLDSAPATIVAASQASILCVMK
jgi:hypothetical protein